MFKKIFASTLTMVLLVASMGFAANMQVNSSAVPVSGGTISPNGIKFSATDVTYTVAPKLGWSLASVVIDGVPAAGAQIVDATHYKVAFDTSKIHTIKANFAQALYSITTTAGAGGSIQITGGGLNNNGGSTNITPGSTRGYVVAPATGFQIASITVNGSPVVPADPTAAYTGSLLNITSNQTVDATFSALPAATVVNAGADVAVAAAPFTTTLVGSVSNATPVTWTVVAGPAGYTFGSANATTTTFSGNAGTYAVRLTAGSVYDDVVVTFGVANTCTQCHAGNQAVVLGLDCSKCHGNGTNGGTHGQFIANSNPSPGNRCIDCHSLAQNAGVGYVQDNNGVRSITQEFKKWSHHVTGVALQDAHCAACHLEGKEQAGSILVDHQYHMADAKVHLRNADTDADMQWDPAAPNHSTMDNFCMSCHDANGATSAKSTAIRATMIPAAGKTASAKNPFGDTISNRYDKMQRPGVVNVDSQFDTTNNSHHGVKGPRYTGRTRAAGARQIANPAAFAANSSATLWGKRSTIYDGVDAITGITGGPKEAFNALYVPLENAGGELAPRTGAQGLGDDSTLHCGDCHTVGQWKPGTAQGYTPTDPATIIPGTSPAIGAHGSNNEYMLRNSKGTDERHTQDAYVSTAGVTTLQNPNAAFLVCFNCHSYERYGSVFNATGTTGPHAGEYDAQGRCNGIGNNIPFNGYTTGKATDGTQFIPRLGLPGNRTLTSSTPAFAPGFPLNFANAPGGVQKATYTGEQNADFGNVFGIQCLNCHNSGVGNGYGGIHGSANDSEGTANSGTPAVAAPAGGAFVNGMGNWSKVERFLPGLGNVMHVPGTLGGVTGGTTYGPITNSTFVYSFTTGGVMNDTNWEQVHWLQGATVATSTVRRGAGCYTLPIGNAASVNSPTFGLEGLPVGGEGSAAVEVEETWGACDDHQGAPAAGGTKGGGDHGFIKRINRPVTY